MAHISDGADVPATLERMRPGDIVTHAFTASGTGIRGGDGRILAEAHRAAERGVRFDIGHGCGSFSWEAADQALAEGLVPDSISTDLHRYSIERPVVDLPTTMSRFLELGLSLAEVVRGRRPSARRRSSGGRSSGRCAPAARPTSRSCASSTSRATCPTRKACAGRVRRQLEAVWTMAGGVLHAVERDARSTCRPLNDADREVDCSVPI